MSSEAKMGTTAPEGRLHLAGVTLWAGLMLVVLAGWLAVDQEAGDGRFGFMAVAGALVAVLGFIAGLRLASGALLARWYALGAMILLLGAGYAWWDKRPIAYTGVLAALAGVCAIMALVRSVSPVHIAESEARVAGDSQRRRLAWVLLAVGVAAVGGGVYLAIANGASATGEAMGLGLLGVVLLGTGLFALAPEHRLDGTGMLTTRGRPVGFGLCTVGLMLGGGALILGTKVHSETNVLMPEVIALAMSALVLFVLGVLFLSDAGVEVMRVAVPFGGVLLAIILIFGSLQWLWAQPDFLRQGGLSSWRGESSWRQWAAAYQILIGLMLPVLAFMLVLDNANEASGARRSLFRLQGIIACAMAFLFVVVVNVFLYSGMPQTYSWTKGRGFYSISDASKRLFSNLKEPTAFYVTYQDRDALIATKNLMDNLVAESSQVSVRYVDPIKDKFIKELVQRYPKLQQDPFGILIVYGQDSGKASEPGKNAFIPERKFVVRDSATTWSYRGEQEVLAEMKVLTRGESGDEAKRVLYFTQGHGELDFLQEDMKKRTSFQQGLSQRGSGLLVKLLKDGQYTVKGLRFDERPAKGAADNVVYLKEEGANDPKDIPDDCGILIVLGPSDPMKTSTLEIFDKYLKRGGKMLACFDVFADNEFKKLRRTGLENVLRNYGANVEDSFILRYTQPTPFDLSARTAPSKLPLASALANLDYLLPLSSRIVTPQPKGKFRAEPLVVVGAMKDPFGGEQEVMAENDVSSLQNPGRHIQALFQAGELQKRRREQRDIVAGVAVSEVLEESNIPGEAKTASRLVVLGDAELVSNGWLGMPFALESHYSLFLNSVDWLQERPTLSGVPPRDMSVFEIRPTTNLDRMTGAPTWLMLLMIVGLGTCLWLVRRR